MRDRWAAANDGVGVEVLGDIVYAAPLPARADHGAGGCRGADMARGDHGTPRARRRCRRGEDGTGCRRHPPRMSTGSSTRWSRAGCSFRSDQGGIRSEGHLRYLIDPAEGWHGLDECTRTRSSAFASPLVGGRMALDAARRRRGARGVSAAGPGCANGAATARDRRAGHRRRADRSAPMAIPLMAMPALFVVQRVGFGAGTSRPPTSPSRPHSALRPARASARTAPRCDRC